MISYGARAHKVTMCFTAGINFDRDLNIWARLLGPRLAAESLGHILYPPALRARKTVGLQGLLNAIRAHRLGWPVNTFGGLLRIGLSPRARFITGFLDTHTHAAGSQAHPFWGRARNRGQFCGPVFIKHLPVGTRTCFGPI